MADKKKRIPGFFKTMFPNWFKGSVKNKETVPGEVLFSNDKKMWEFYQAMTMTGNNKTERIEDYEEMIVDPIVLAATELVAEDSFLIDDQSHSLTINAKKKIKDNTIKFFEDFNIEDNLIPWAFGNAYYGEVPLLLDGQMDQGITDINSDIHPLDFHRIQSGSLFGFMTPYRTEKKGSMTILAPWEMVHIYHKKNYRKKRYEDLKRVKMGDKQIILDNFDVVGYLEPVRRIYKKLKLVEDSLVLARLDRAPLKRVFYIDVGDAEPKEKIKLMDEFKKNYKTEVGFNRDGYYKSEKNPLTYGQELFIPLSEGVKSISTEEYGGDTDVKAIVDIEYLTQKFFGGLKISKAILGLTEDLPGSLGESALVRLEIRYARVVKANRRGVMNGLYRLAQIHNAYLGQEVNLDDLTITANSISTAEEEEMRSIFDSRIESASDFVSLLENIGVVTDEYNENFVKYIIFDLLKLSSFDMSVLIKAVEHDPAVADELKKAVRENLPIHGPVRGDAVYEIPTKAGRKKWEDRWNLAFGTNKEAFKIQDPKSNEAKRKED